MLGTPNFTTGSFLFSPEVPLIDQLERVLGTASSFQFDAWELESASQGHPLSTLGYWLMHESGLIGRFGISGRTLARFLRAVEAGYQGNPYHNKTHAADVLQSVHVLLTRGGVAPHYATPFTQMCCYLAAVMHDYDHRGVTNDHLVATRHELALRYNDRAPHENHHLAAAFGLLRAEGHDFLSHLDKGEWDKMRKTVIELVLATDMKQHFAINGQFSSVHRLATADTVKAIVAAAASAKQNPAAALATLSVTASGHSF